MRREDEDSIQIDTYQSAHRYAGLANMAQAVNPLKGCAVTETSKMDVNFTC